MRRLGFIGNLALCAGIALSWGCGDGGSGGDDDDDGNGSDVDAGGGPGDVDAGGGGGGGEFTQLIRGDWNMPAGTEDYVCVYKTVERDMYVTAFRPIIPSGTHHTVLTIGSKQREDGIVPCGAGTNYDAMIFGSGVGTNELHLPDGIAVKLNAGDQLLLNLHIFNFTDNSLDGQSGTDVIEVAEADVAEVAEAVMASKFQLFIPSGPSTQTGTCTANSAFTIHTVSPHMHMLGTHMKVVAERAAGDVVLMDDPYNFDLQVINKIDPVEMAPGDKVRFECTYNNTTGGLVTFGDSSLQEMCIVGMFRTPALDEGTFCTDEF